MKAETVLSRSSDGVKEYELQLCVKSDKGMYDVMVADNNFTAR